MTILKKKENKMWINGASTKYIKSQNAQGQNTESRKLPKIEINIHYNYDINWVIMQISKYFGHF